MKYVIEQRKKDLKGQTLYCLLYVCNNYRQANSKALYYSRFVENILFSCYNDVQTFVIAESR